ncbi:MAG: TIGR03545 family protein, partial [bacterium]
GLRRAGETAAGAKVEIGRVKTGFFPPFLTITDMAVADRSDPYKNLFQFEKLSFSMEGRPLLEKKFTVKDATLQGLKFNTKRELPGTLSAPREDSAVLKAFDKLFAKSKDFSLERAADVKTGIKENISVSASSLESAKLAETLKVDFSAESDGWKKALDTAGINDKLDKLKTELEKLKKEGDVIARVAGANSLLKDLAALKAETDSVRKKLEHSLNDARSSLSALDEARRKDMDVLMKQLKIPTLDSRSLTGVLLGPSAGGRIAQVLHWMEISRRYMPAKKTPPPQRSKGAVIHFKKKKAAPSFLLAHMKISGDITLGSEHSPLSFDGTAENFTSQPDILGKPAIIRLKGDAAGKTLTVMAELNHSGETPRDRLAVSLKNFPLGEYKSGGSGFLARTSGGRGSASSDLELNGNKIGGKVILRAEGLKLEIDAGNAKEPVKSAVTRAAESIRSLNAVITVSGTLQEPSFSASSNMGDALSSALKQSTGKELEARRKELEARLDEAIKPLRAGLEKDIGEKEKEISEKLNINSQKISEIQNDLLKKLKSDKNSIIPSGLKIPGLKF